MHTTRRTPRTSREAPYALTPLGAGLLPVFKRLLPWGRKLVEHARAASAV